MRNLKRALSLALASVMVLGLMIVGTSAASYPDVDSEDNVEAIEVAQAVGIMVGDDNGNFNPDQNVTRAQMAAVMFNLLKLDVDDYTVAPTPFKDVPTWATSYVTGCYANGIVAGTSATTFDPDAAVTAPQAALMIMKALGYFQYDKDFGEDWQLATIAQGSKIGLFNGVSSTRTQSLTRNDVAQMSLNALKASMVEVTDAGLNVTTPDGFTVTTGGAKYSVRTVTATGNSKYAAINGAASSTGGTGAVYTVELGEELYNGNLVLRGSSDDFGRPADRWTYKNTLVGVYADEPTLTYTAGVKGKTVLADLGNPALGTIIKNKTDDKYFVTAIDGKDGAGDGTDGTIDAANISSSYDKDLAGTGKGVLTEVFYDADANSGAGKLTIVSINTYLAKATSDYDSANKNVDVLVYGIPAVATIDGEDFNVSGVKKDDYLLITASVSGSDWTVQSIATPEVLSNVAVVGSRANDYVSVDGTRYSYNFTSRNDAAAMGYELMTAKNEYVLNRDGYNVILDTYGNAIGVDGEGAGLNLANYLFVEKVAGDQDGLNIEAKVMFMDGTEKIITVSKVAKAGEALKDATGKASANDTETTVAPLSNDGEVGAHLFYTYTISKGEYQLTEVADDGDGIMQDINIGKNAGYTLTGSGTRPLDKSGTAAKYVATSNSVFIANGVVYEGQQKAPKTAAGHHYVLANGDRIMAVVTTQKGKMTTTMDNLIYLTSSNEGFWATKDGVNYYIYKCVGGEDNEIYASSAALTAGMHKIDSYSDGYADLTPVVPGTAKDEFVEAYGVTEYKYADHILTLVGASMADSADPLSWYILDDVVVYAVDGTTVTKVGNVASLQNSNYSGKYANIVMVKEADDDDDIVAIYVIKSDERVAKYNSAEQTPPASGGNGLQMTISTNKQSFNVGDEVVVTITMGNAQATSGGTYSIPVSGMKDDSVAATDEGGTHITAQKFENGVLSFHVAGSQSVSGKKVTLTGKATGNVVVGEISFSAG